MKTIEWTSEEKDFLLKNYAKYGPEYCSKFISRNRNAIIKKARLLKLKYTKIKNQYLEENIRPIVENSKSISDVLDFMILRKAGGNYKVIWKYIKMYNINIDHFESQSERFENMVKNFVRQPIDSLLVENSTTSRTNLKKRIIKNGLIRNICCLCGQNDNWNGMKISLILDHINGVNNDNRLENLRIICPNCNAGLITFAGRNSIKK